MAFASPQQNKKPKKPEPTLDNFYIVTQSIADPSDATTKNPPAWTDTILDIAPAGEEVRARTIIIEPVTAPHCPPHAVIARAIERTLTATTVAREAGHHHLCAMSESDVAGVIQAANKDEVARANSDDFVSQTIVASCSGAEKLFELPDPDTLRFHALGLADEHITALWKMAREVSDRAFGDADPLAQAITPAAADDLAQQKLAATLVEEIRAGKYASGFGDSNCDFASCRDHSAASALQGYAGVLDPATCAAPPTQ